MQRFPISGADAGCIRRYGSGKRRFMVWLLTHCPAICEKERLSNRKNKSPAQAGDSACQITLRRGRLRHIAPLCRCSEFAVDFEIIVHFYCGPMWASAPTVRKTQVFRQSERPAGFSGGPYALYGFILLFHYSQPGFSDSGFRWRVSRACTA